MSRSTMDRQFFSTAGRRRTELHFQERKQIFLLRVRCSVTEIITHHASAAAIIPGQRKQAWQAPWRCFWPAQRLGTSQFNISSRDSAQGGVFLKVTLIQLPIEGSNVELALDYKKQHRKYKTIVELTISHPHATPWRVALTIRCLSHAPYSQLWVNVTSPTKPEVHNWLHCRQRRTEPRSQVTCTENFVKFGHVVFRRPFVKQFALCHPTVVLSVCLSACLSCLWRWCIVWPNGWMDQDETWQGGRLRPQLHCVRLGSSSPLPKGAQSSNFRPMSVVAKQLDGWRCHLVRR